METKYTSGPWHIMPGCSLEEPRILMGDESEGYKGELVAVAHGRDAENVARLIASSPMLAEALLPLERVASSIPEEWNDDKEVIISVKPSEIRAAVLALTKAGKM